MYVSSGKRGNKFLQDESVQAIAAVIDIAGIAADKGWRNQEGFSSGKIGLEGWHVADFDAQRRRPGARSTVSTGKGVEMYSANAGKFPSDVKPLRCSDLKRQPRHRTSTVGGIARERLIGVSAHTFNQRAALSGSVARTALDPPGVHFLVHRDHQMT